MSGIPSAVTEKTATLSFTFTMRIAAMPADALEPCLDEGVCRALDALQAAVRRTEKVKEEALEELFVAVGATKDAARRRALLRCRRDVFNDRSLGELTVRTALDVDADMCLSAVNEYLEAAQDRDRAASALLRHHAEARARAKCRMRALADDASFDRGLLLASPALYAALAGWRKRDESLSARNEYIERGIVRYLMRAHAKATPFGSFCTIAGGRFHCSDIQQEQWGLDKTALTSAVRLNKALYSILWRALLRMPAFALRVPVQLNESVTEHHGERVTFLASANGHEVVRRIPRSPALARTLEILSVMELPTTASLALALAEDAGVDATHEAATLYAQQLVNVGLLRTISPVQEGSGEWVQPLVQSLRASNDERLISAAAYLERAQAATNELAGAVGNERVRVHERIAQDLGSVHREIVGSELPARMTLVYEDVGHKESVELAVDQDLRAALTSLTHFVGSMQKLAHVHWQQAVLCQCWRYYNGASSLPVPLMQFYEQYRAYVHGRGQQHRGEDGRCTQMERSQARGEDTRIAELNSVLGSLSALIAYRWSQAKAAEEVDISLVAIDKILAGVPAEEVFWPTAMFAQLMPQKGGETARVVIEKAQLYRGCGKYHSRFAHVLPPDVYSAIGRENTLDDSLVLAEISTDAGFNGNLHPALTCYSISYPTAPGRARGRSLRCADLEVAPDAEMVGVLVLRERKSGRRVVPVDLGFLSLGSRPPLYQLLAKFAPGGLTLIPLPEHWRECRHDVSDRTENISVESASPRSSHSTQPAEAADMVYRPRIVIAGRIVLARRRWTVPSRHVPVREKGEELSGYFARLNIWRCKCGLPRQVFVRSRKADLAADGQASPTSDAQVAFTRGAGTGRCDPASGMKHSFRNVDPVADERAVASDRHKPQLVDFAIPLLCEMFAHIAGYDRRDTLIMEERYPDVERLPHCDGRPHAAEFVLQWNGQARR